MELLKRLFEGPSAERISRDNSSILVVWKIYIATVPEKQQAAEKGAYHNVAKFLRQELADVKDEEKEDIDLIKELKEFSHSEKMRRVEKLERCLNYALTQAEYLERLLEHLHLCLKTQARLTKIILAGSKKEKELSEHLQSQIDLESTIIDRVSKVNTFKKLFPALVKGEKVIRKLETGQNKLKERMREVMQKIFTNALKTGVVFDWTQLVFDAIEDRVHESVAMNALSYHPDIDFEYVNRPEFVDLVREKRNKVVRTPADETMIRAFVDVFREWYNFQRE